MARSFSGRDHQYYKYGFSPYQQRFFVWLKQVVSLSRPEIAQASRAVALKHGRRPPPEAARSVLDRDEHDAKLARSGVVSCNPNHCCSDSKLRSRMLTTFAEQALFEAGKSPVSRALMSGL